WRRAYWCHYNDFRTDHLARTDTKFRGDTIASEREGNRALARYRREIECLDDCGATILVIARNNNRASSHQGNLPRCRRNLDMTQEEAIQIFCNGVPLVGILHRSQSDAHRGMVIVVGGPQYRVGSHRQFILLARFLAESGVPVLRFDHRGIGDSDGLFLGFEQIDDDLAVAIDALMLHVP